MVRQREESLEDEEGSEMVVVVWSVSGVASARWDGSSSTVGFPIGKPRGFWSTAASCTLSDCLSSRQAGLQQASADAGSSGMMRTSRPRGFSTSQSCAACKSWKPSRSWRSSALPSIAVVDGRGSCVVGFASGRCYIIVVSTLVLPFVLQRHIQTRCCSLTSRVFVT